MFKNSLTLETDENKRQILRPLDMLAPFVSPPRTHSYFRSTSNFSPVPSNKIHHGGCHDQADAEWIVIRGH
jgi:hypothetical protein